MSKKLWAAVAIASIIVIWAISSYAILSKGPFPHTFRDGTQGLLAYASVPYLLGEKIDCIVELPENLEGDWEAVEAAGPKGAEWGAYHYYDDKNGRRPLWSLDSVGLLDSHELTVYFKPRHADADYRALRKAVIYGLFSGASSFDSRGHRGLRPKSGTKKPIKLPPG